MHSRPLRSLAVLLVVGVTALTAGAGALADAGLHGPPTAIGTGIGCSQPPSPCAVAAGAPWW